eukprot:GHUV01026862.1.p1 GENE.GHUV01026862.1~~GHUV01026862.1.p1  ORF type:complete len:260 (+),score=37.97 GHUV01026862.1:166-945(+)
METAKRDIDDIWCKLKQRQPHSSRSQSFEQLWSGLHSETSSSKGRQPAPGASRGELQFYLHKVGSQQHAQHAATPKPPDTSLQSHGLDGAALERLLKSLVSSDAPTRRAALQQIKASYSSNGNSSSSTAASAVAGALRSKLGKSLLRSFDDHSEACRQLAITVFKEALQASPDAALAMLPYAMPVLEERLHTDEVGDCTPDLQVLAGSCACLFGYADLCLYQQEIILQGVQLRCHFYCATILTGYCSVLCCKATTDPAV